MRVHLLLLALFAALVSPATSAEPASIVDSFDVSGFMATGPEGIVFDPVSGHLFVVTSSTPTVGNGLSTTYEITTSGELVDTWQFAVDEAEGLTLSPQGNLLFTDSQTAGAVHEYTTFGRRIQGGLNFPLHPPSDDADGITWHARMNAFFVVDEERRTVFRFAADGASSSVAFKTMDLSPGFTKPEGIAADPLTGNLLIVDTAFGSSSLYEVTPRGVLVSKLFLGFDAEGVTIDPATRTLYIADDGGSRIHIATAPEPDTSGPRPVTMVSAASFTAPVAPASIASAFIEGPSLLNSLPQTAATTPSPGAVTVTIADSTGAEFAAPLFFVGANQVNLYIEDAAAEGEATIKIYDGDAHVGAGTFEIRNVAPGLFFVGDNVAAAFALTVNPDSTRTQVETFDSTTAPRQIALGPEGADVYLLLFGTGIRASADAITATAGGDPVPVLGAAPHSTFAGLDQVNIGPLPRTLTARGLVDVVLTVAGANSNTVQVHIK